MNADSLAIVVLAAGLGKRMGSELPKVLSKTKEKELIHHVMDTVSALNPARTVIVTGHKRELVEAAVKGGKVPASAVRFAVQEQQRGTGDAVKSALGELNDFSGEVLILYGDCPLIGATTLERLISQHRNSKNTVTFISFNVEAANQYGRVLRDGKKAVSGIKEARDCSAEELLIKEVNSGIYVVDSSFLRPAIEALTNDNAQGEYYLTDIVSHASREGQKTDAVLFEEADEFLGVNTLYDLTKVNGVLNMKKVRDLIDSGVKIEDPATCYVDPEVQVASGVVLGPNVKLAGKTVIGSGVIIEGSAFIVDSVIDENCIIKFNCRIEGAKIGKECAIGPFANVRPGSVFESKVKIGNFVETKKAQLRSGAKASHLTYLGDCEVGKDTNIGAGTITCNYDGYKKYVTTIGERVFIGSNTALVAPVVLGDGCTIGAGSVITKDVEADSLSITRPQQVSKSGWSRRKRELMGEDHR